MAQPTIVLSLQERTDSALRDLEVRTLTSIDGALAQLVYLASTRDYNTGEYFHEGLAFRYGQDAAAKALEIAHGRTFESVLLAPLQDLCQEIALYIESSAEPAKTMDAWRRIKAYQLLVPAVCDPVSASLFSSNIQLALGVLLLRREGAGRDAYQGHGHGHGHGQGPGSAGGIGPS